MGPAVRRFAPFALMVVDQGILSALMLVMNLALIRGGNKDDYALFVIVMSVILLAQTIQNATICMPLMVMGPGWDAREREGFRAHLRSVNARGGVLSAVVCGAGALAWGWRNGHVDVGLVMSAGLAVLGVWLREYRRTVQLQEGRVAALTASDAVAAGIVMLWLLFAAMRGTGISAVDVLTPLGLANLAVSVRGAVARKEASPAPGDKVLSYWRTRIKASTVGSAVAWLQASSYPILVAAVVGKHAAAEVAAARLFLSPGLLFVTAWGRLGIVHGATAIREGGVSAWKRFVATETVRVAAGAVGYILAMGIALHIGLIKIMGQHYDNTTLIWYWMAVGFVTAIRSVPGVALQAAVAFADLSRWGAASAIVSCTSVLVLGRYYGAVGCVSGLIAGELLTVVALFTLVRARSAVRPTANYVPAAHSPSPTL